MAFPGQKIKTSILKRYLLHGKKYVSGLGAGTGGFHEQALEVQISWITSSATVGEILGSFICCLFHIFRGAHHQIKVCEIQRYHFQWFK